MQHNTWSVCPTGSESTASFSLCATPVERPDAAPLVLRDLSPNAALVEHLADLFNRAQPQAEHLHEILEDFLS